MRLRIASYNIHKCIGGADRRYRPERIRDAITPFDPDIVLLQEVDEGARRSRRHRQVDLLGELLGLRHRRFFPNVKVRGGGHCGNAILSRFPITDARNIDLSVPWTKRRSVLHARIRVRRPGVDPQPRTLHVFDFHLGLSQLLRLEQLRRFLASPSFLALHARTPIVLGGDFNDARGTLGKLMLAPAGFRGAASPPATFPAVAPMKALDSIYVRGDVELLQVRRCALRAARWASDHRPLLAEIRVLLQGAYGRARPPRKCAKLSVPASQPLDA
ncbi:MAG: endonuclease/exonuclease/phosphatase family protein [Elusimicrobia bacterium]|nr:endonuclease/exonuclease/phosphatase family protein [Elusimicrobiota bacterium]